MKYLFLLAGILISIGVAVIPELCMYGLYRFINPVSELGRIGMFAIFWGMGAGLCILAAAIGVLILFATISAVNK